MSQILSFDEIVAKLDRWNAQRLATITERSMSVDEEQVEQKLESSSVSVLEQSTTHGDEQRYFERNLSVNESQLEANDVISVGKNDHIQRKNFYNPMASSTPIPLSPTSTYERHREFPIHNISGAHSIISSITKSSSDKPVSETGFEYKIHSNYPHRTELVIETDLGISQLHDRNDNIVDIWRSNLVSRCPDKDETLTMRSDSEESRKYDFSSNERTELNSIPDSASVAPSSDEAIFQDMVHRLNNAILVQETQMAQASAALMRLREDGRFGTYQELNIQRVLLLANAKWKAYKIEMNRLTTSYVFLQKLPKNEKALIKVIYVHYMKFLLNRNYCVKANQQDNLWAYVVLLKCADQVFATQVTAVKDMGTLRDRMVSIRDLIRFEDLPSDFQALVEIYGVTSDKNKNRNCIASFAGRIKAFLHSPRSSSKKNIDLVQPEEQGLQFRLCGYFHLNRESIGVQKLCIQEAVYPLDGTVEIRTSSP